MNIYLIALNYSKGRIFNHFYYCNTLKYEIDLSFLKDWPIHIQRLIEGLS